MPEHDGVLSPAIALNKLVPIYSPVLGVFLDSSSSKVLFPQPVLPCSALKRRRPQPFHSQEQTLLRSRRPRGSGRWSKRRASAR